MMYKGATSKIAMVVLIIIGFIWVTITILSSIGTGFTMNMNGGTQMGSGMYSAGTGVFLLSILIKVLFALFVVGLVVGLFVWIKDNIFTVEDRDMIKRTLSLNKQTTEAMTCNSCGKALNSDWKVCPYCGKEELQ